MLCSSVGQLKEYNNNSNNNNSDNKDNNDNVNSNNDNKRNKNWSLLTMRFTPLSIVLDFWGFLIGRAHSSDLDRND